MVTDGSKMVTDGSKMVTGCLPGKNCFSRLILPSKLCQLHIVTLLLGKGGGLNGEVEEKVTSEHFHFKKDFVAQWFCNFLCAFTRNLCQLSR